MSAVSVAAPSADARRVAVEHARLLQQRRDIESEILDSLALLSEFPLVRSPDHSASSPAASDAAGFRAHVRLFQPSDYADLIEERNVNGLCGYVLCPAPRRDTGSGGEWKITSHGDIVRRKDLEMWCSDSCARRALFVKVQLNETAAWERAGIPDIRINLLGDDDGESGPDRAARELSEAQLDDRRHAARHAAALAMDRGQRSVITDPAKVKVAIKENPTKAPPAASAPPVQDEDHLVIEGHKTQLPLRPRPRQPD